MTEWVVSLALIAVVLRQVRGRRLTLVGLLWPLPLVAWAAVQYGGDVPAYGTDWAFVAALAAGGIALGAGCAALTALTLGPDGVVARAGVLAAALWIVGMSGRLAFGLYATHGGAAAIGRLSARLGIHAASTWASGLIAMALAEVVARSAVLLARSRRASFAAG